MTLHAALLECATNRELVEQYDRLSGTSLAKRRAPIEIAIDDATGHQEQQWCRFFDWCMETIVVPVLVGGGPSA